MNWGAVTYNSSKLNEPHHSEALLTKTWLSELVCYSSIEDTQDIYNWSTYLCKRPTGIVPARRFWGSSTSGDRLVHCRVSIVVSLEER